MTLPVEHELVDENVYQIGDTYVWWDLASRQFRVPLFRDTDAVVVQTSGLPVHRLAPVARYEPPVPETPEPKGLGAVVRDAKQNYWSRTNRDWAYVWSGYGKWARWSDISQPAEVLSEGVEL